MGSLLMVTGPPGSGKSTVSRILADGMERSVLVEGDAFFAFLAAGAILPWLPESDDQNRIVTESAASATARFAADYDVVYDGVVGPWTLDRFMAAGSIDTLEYAVLLPPVDVCVDRVTLRTGHGFTDHAAARHMHEQFASSEIAGRHVFTEMTNRPEEMADLITARRASRSLIIST